jgi:hypothetical protein
MLSQDPTTKYLLFCLLSCCATPLGLATMHLTVQQTIADLQNSKLRL